MPIRNRHKVGDYLMVDEESGFTHYASEMARRWDGVWVHHSNMEERNPQDFVRARNDPKPLSVIRPAPALSAACATYFDLYVAGSEPTIGSNWVVGETVIGGGIETPKGAATHLFDVGVSSAEIGCSFVVR